jgi:hypothetical protein
MEWISVKDKLPELKSAILSTDGDIVAVTIYEYNDCIKSYCWSYFSSGCGCCDTDMNNVTHWMPLPSLPLS